VFDKKASTNAAEMVHWCLERKGNIVAVDAPCGWSQFGSSRLAERELKLANKIYCFATPSLARARKPQKGILRVGLQRLELVPAVEAPLSALWMEHFGRD
jgi:hypothetical protein